jgi:hypothetical protein
MKKRYFIEIVKYNYVGMIDNIPLSTATETKEKAIDLFMDFIKKAREEIPAADGVILSYGYNAECAEVLERWGRL